MKPATTPSLGQHAVLLAATLLIGCAGGNESDNRPATVPVTGTVTLDGQPLPGATVIFASPRDTGAASSTHSAVGVTDQNGVYRTTTFKPGDGAVPGTYLVTITKFAAEAPGPSTAAPKADTGEGESLEGESYIPPTATGSKENTPKNEVPEKYSKPTTSGLEATITPDGKNEIPFDLSSK